MVMVMVLQAEHTQMAIFPVLQEKTQDLPSLLQLHLNSDTVHIHQEPLEEKCAFPSHLVLRLFFSWVTRRRVGIFGGRVSVLNNSDWLNTLSSRQI